MIRLNDHYDWVVLGDHPGALLSASLASRLGLSVLILPLAPSVTLSVSRGGQFLDPETNYLLGFGGLLGECLTRLGILPSEAELLRPVQASVPQILTPEARVRVFSGADDGIRGFERELERELGQETAAAFALPKALQHSAAEFSKFWLKLPQRLTAVPPKSRRNSTPAPEPVKPASVAELRRELLKSAGMAGSAAGRWLETDRRSSRHALELGNPGLAELCSGLWFAATSSAAPDPRLSELLQAVALATGGVSFKGGMTAYRELLFRIARRLGAHVPPKSDCRRVFIDDGRFVGVQVASRGNMIAARGAVLGCGLSLARESYSISGRSWFKRPVAPPVPLGWKFTVALTVATEAIPPGMGPRAVWQEPGAPVLEIEVVDPADYGVREPDRKTVYLRTVLPFTQESLAPAFQRMTAARMLRQATELLPFLERHVVRVYPEFRARTMPSHNRRSLGHLAAERDELSEAYGFPLPELIPENLRVLERDGVGSRSGFDGLFVATGESFPALGTLGPTVAAIEAVAWLAHRSGLAGPFV